MLTADHAAWRHLPTAVEVVTLPAESGVMVLDDLRRHVAQPLHDDDAHLQDLQEAAERVIESRLARPLFAQTRRAWFDGVPGPVVRLSEPATGIVSVTAYGTDDAPAVVAPATYQADVASEPARVALRQGQQWPTALRTRQSLAVTYTAGWARVDIPRNVRLAAALLVAHWYEHREAVVVGEAAMEIPMGIDVLLQRHSLAMGVA